MLLSLRSQVKTRGKDEFYLGLTYGAEIETHVRCYVLELFCRWYLLTRLPTPVTVLKGSGFALEGSCDACSESELPAACENCSGVSFFWEAAPGLTT
jgi:hypothetical protein